MTRPPLWLLPNLLAVDAPLAAAVWQRSLGAAFGVRVPAAATAALVLLVWAVYLADRLWDARRGDRLADRHRFAGRFPGLYAGAAAVSLLGAAAAASCLPVGYWWGGLAVAAGVGAYLAVVHLLPAGIGRRGAKELLVAVGFAAGVAVPLMADGPAVREWLPAAAGFAAACWLNCRLIDRWEGGRPRLTAGDGLLAAAVVGCGFGLRPPVGLAVGGAGVGLLAVHVACRGRPRVARALADVPLLLPLVVGSVS